MSPTDYGDLDDFSRFERPRRRTRPRTKDRPTYDDAVPGLVVTVDRGRFTIRLDGDRPTIVTAMSSRQLGRKGLVVVGDRVRWSAMSAAIRAAWPGSSKSSPARRFFAALPTTPTRSNASSSPTPPSSSSSPLSPIPSPVLA